jgi:hypothetical protein
VRLPSFFAAATSASRLKFASIEAPGSGAAAFVPAVTSAPVEGAHAAAASASSAAGMSFRVRLTMASLLLPLGVVCAAQSPGSGTAVRSTMNAR